MSSARFLRVLLFEALIVGARLRDVQVSDCLARQPARADYSGQHSDNLRNSAISSECLRQGISSEELKMLLSLSESSRFGMVH